MYNLFKSAGSMSAFSSVINDKSKDDKGNRIRLKNRILFNDTDHFVPRVNVILTNPRNEFYD